MRVTVHLDDDLIRKAQEFTGIMDLSILMNEGLKALIHLETLRRRTEPNVSFPPLNPN
jgi:hypothetical protein